MIADAHVLRPEFVPRDVVHRDAEVSHLSNTLRPITDGNRAETALLCGPSGAGKTCIARFTVGRLRENALSVDHQYINCWEDCTRFKTFYRLLEGLNQAFDFTGNPPQKTNSSNVCAPTRDRPTSPSSMR
jgi:Cdc6-like AAA superfamily ATPase